MLLVRVCYTATALMECYGAAFCTRSAVLQALACCMLGTNCVLCLPDVPTTTIRRVRVISTCLCRIVQAMRCFQQASHMAGLHAIMTINLARDE